MREKEIYLAMVNDYLAHLHEQATDLSAQMVFLMAKRQDTGPTSKLLLPILSALTSLRMTRDRVLLTIYKPDD